MMTKQAELKQRAYASNLKSLAFSILIYLIDRSNKELTCFPAIPTMAEQLHISVSTVKRALYELLDAGFIQKEARFREKNRGQTSNLYTLVFREEAPTPNNDNSAVSDNSEPINTTDDHDNADKSGYVPAHLSLDTIVQEMAPQNQEMEATRESTVVAESALLGQAHATPSRTTHTPVHFNFLRKLLPNGVTSLHKENAGLFLPCNPFFSLWTGAESILIPP